MRWISSLCYTFSITSLIQSTPFLSHVRYAEHPLFPAFNMPGIFTLANLHIRYFSYQHFVSWVSQVLCMLSWDPLCRNVIKINIKVVRTFIEFAALFIHFSFLKIIAGLLKINSNQSNTERFTQFFFFLIDSFGLRIDHIILYYVIIYIFF